MMSTMMMDRPGMTGMGTMGGSPMGMAGTTIPTGMTGMAPGMVMVPRCTFKVEKISGGMKMTCTCDDATACAMMQNLCKMMAGGMMSVCCMMNGMTVCTMNMTMGMCKCEMTEMGCVMTCTSGDAGCCKMIQACCDCMTACMAGGCTCCVMMNNTPVCCGCC